MTKSLVKTLYCMSLVAGAGLIAISAWTLASTSASAAAPAVSTSQQVAQNQQQQIPPPQQQQPEKNNQGGQQQKNLQNGQQQYPQGGQQPKNPQNGQQQILQGGQQPKNLQNGQQQNLQSGQQQQNLQGHRYDWSAYQPGHRPPQWQQYRLNFNPRPYEFNRDAERRYHWQPYVQPRGWYYQRWVYGQILPVIFWVPEYWLDSYWEFGLIDPPYGYVWVRYGNDALLVDVETGQILGVEYGVFY